MAKTRLNQEILRERIVRRLFEPKEGADAADGPGLLGMELESFPVGPKKGHAASTPVSFAGGQGSLSKALIDASARSGGRPTFCESRDDVELKPKLLERIDFTSGAHFHFEPGAQIEIVTAPCAGMDDAEGQIIALQRVQEEVTRREGIRFEPVGTNPWFDTDEIGLQVDKPRYVALHRYLSGIGEHGPKMMRQTCSIQINLDLGSDEAIGIRRYVAANLIAPFATAVFANSPVIAGVDTGHQSHRSFLWQHLDPRRTGIVLPRNKERLLDKQSLVDAYTDFALNAPAITADHERVESFTQGQLENQLSLLFPEVRPKGFIEIRSVDTQQPKWQMVPAALYTGLLYSNPHLDATLDLLLPLAKDIDQLLRDSVFGLHKEVIFWNAKRIMGIALQGFESLGVEFTGQGHFDTLIEYNERFLARRKTPADEFLETDFR